MRSLISILILTAISCNEPVATSEKNVNEILLYFINDKTITLRPGQITEEDFWGNAENLDTIKLRDTAGEYTRRFSSLRDTVLYSPGEVDLFDHVFAFVFESTLKPDTLYADATLKLFEWKGRKRFYQDTSSFFKNKFSPMRK